MRRLMALGVLVLALFLVPAESVFADSHLPGQPPRPAPAAPAAAAPARAGGPELAAVAGTLGVLGASAVGGSLLLRRRRSD